MAVRFNTNHYGSLTAFTISVAMVLCAHAQAAAPSVKTSGTAPFETHGGLLRATAEQNYFEYRSGIPLVEQFMKKWNAQRHS